MLFVQHLLTLWFAFSWGWGDAYLWKGIFPAVIACVVLALVAVVAVCGHANCGIMLCVLKGAEVAQLSLASMHSWHVARVCMDEGPASTACSCKQQASMHAFKQPAP
jgi:hypothetical protein